jgi:hypothetical protein
VGDRAASRRGNGRSDRDRPARPGRARCRPGTRHGRRDRARGRRRSSGRGAAACIAAVHRRGPLRDSRHRPQPRHVPASVRRGPARERRGLEAHRPGISPWAARPRGGRFEGDWCEPRGGVRRPGAGDRGERGPRAPRAPRAVRVVAPDARRDPRRAAVPGRLLPHPGRVQGDDGGPVRSRVRDLAPPARTGGAHRSRRTPGADRGTACRPRRRDRLRLQLSWPPVARWRSRDLGARRARGRTATPRRGGSSDDGHPLVRPPPRRWPGPRRRAQRSHWRS